MRFDSRQAFYKAPFGAVPAGTPVRLRLRLPKGLPAPAPRAVFAPMGREEAPLILPLAPAGEDETSLHYQCTFTPAAPDVLLYRFQYRDGDGTRTLLRDPLGSGDAEDGGVPWRLTVYDPAFETPEALQGAVFYQIFPDRFAASGDPKAGVPGDRVLHAAWDEAPVDRPGPDGEFRCGDYFGGDLGGIRQKLPYLRDLGVEAVYLNPIFEAHSNHRYNTADYRRIDPLLGNNEDFSALCKAGEGAGVSFILDGVFNHTGSDSVYFNREGRYGPGGAFWDVHSPYRDWYRWTGDPARPYDSWWGFLTLPSVDEDCPGYREFLCGPDGVLAQWLGTGAAGFRLDVADELPGSLIADIRARMKEEDRDSLLLGEVWEDATTKYSYGRHRRYLLGQELDSVMNYPWRTAILDFLRDGRGRELGEALLSVWEHYPRPAAQVLLNVLSTHDVPRAITVLGGPPMGGHGRDWQRAHNALTPEQYARGRQLFLLASLIQFSLPGCPCLYYGDEAGLSGYADPFNRGTYPWGREDRGLVDFFRLLGPLRKGNPILRRGDFVPVRFDADWCVFFRRLGDEAVLTAVYRGEDYGEIPWDPTVLQHGIPLLTVGEASGIRGLYPRSGVIMAFPKGMTVL